jgi:hypothetical protein
MNKTRMAILAAVVAALLGLAFGLQRQNGPEKAGEIAGQGQAGTPGLATPAGAAVGAEAATEAVTPEMLESLTTATAQIVRGDGSKEAIRSVDGEFDRVQVEPNEHLKIRLALRGFDSGREVLVEADNGGSLNRRVGPLVLQPAAGEDAIEFDFAIGGNTGRYTLMVSQDGRQERMEFRAGPEPPTGQAGPIRIFNPDPI